MIRKLIIISCLTAFCVSIASAQSLSALQSEQRATRAEIARIASELARTAGSQKDVASRLGLLETKIDSRRKLVRNVQSQISLTDRRLGTLQGEVSIKEQELRKTYSAYKQSVADLYSYLRRTASSGSRKSHSAARTVYFGRLVCDTLAARASALTRAGVELRGEVQTVGVERAALDSLHAEHARELSTLDTEIAEARALATKLDASARSLSEKERQYRAKIADLERKIKEAVASEVKSSNAQKSEVNPALSADFAKNKGRLPWPVAMSAVVIDNYGLNNVQKGVKLENKGINLRLTGGDRQVRSIFGGEVRRVFSIIGIGQSVIVRHGEFLSVYSSLSEINVSVGQQIGRGETIGEVGDEGNLHFELWRENSPLNPTEWLVKKNGISN